MKQPVRIFLRAVLLACFAFAISQTAVAQNASGGSSSSAPAKDTTEKRIGLEITLHLLVASNGQGLQGAKPSPAMESVVKQLREALNVSSVNVASTLFHRVESGSGLFVKGVGTASLASPTSNPQTTPTFYDYNIDRVLLDDATDGSGKIRLGKLYLSMRFPIYLQKGEGTQTTVSYESIQIVTSASLKENTPTIIGTTNVGRPDETLVVVITIKKASDR
jgi:hypothetical protein